MHPLLTDGAILILVFSSFDKFVPMCLLVLSLPSPLPILNYNWCKHTLNNTLYLYDLIFWNHSFTECVHIVMAQFWFLYYYEFFHVDSSRDVIRMNNEMFKQFDEPETKGKKCYILLVVFRPLLKVTYRLLYFH